MTVNTGTQVEWEGKEVRKQSIEGVIFERELKLEGITIGKVVQISIQV